MNSGIIGEYYTLCELWKKGINALKADNPVQRSWDILVINKNIKLQVKTIDWTKEKSRTTQGNYTKGFDFLVVVLLGFNNKEYTVLVIPKSKLRERPEDQKHNLLDKEDNFLYTKKTITWTTLKQNWKIVSAYEDNWNQLKCKV